MGEKNMEILISKKSIFLISSLLILFLLLILIIFPYSENPILFDNNHSDNSLKVEISNLNISMLWTTDIHGNLVNDFKPGDMVYIHGSNFIPETHVELNITRPDNSVEIAPGGRYTSDSLPITNQNGDFHFYEYDLNGIEGEYLIQATDNLNYALLIFFDGSIWTTDGYAQQKNKFISGEPVGLDGEGLTPNAYLYYEIKDNPSGGDNVSWGWINTNNAGDINFSIIWDIPISYSKTGQHKVFVFDTQTKTKTFSIVTGPCTDLDGDGHLGWDFLDCPDGDDCDDNDASIWQILEGYIDNDNDDFGYGDMTTICSGEELKISWST
jgi:hypothetical protein